MLQKKSCPDCGSAPTIHFLERIEAYFEIYLIPFFRPLDYIADWLGKTFGKLTHQLTPGFINFLCLLKIGRLMDEPDQQTVYRARCLWEEAKKRKIKMQEFRLFNFYNDTFIAHFEKQFCIFQGLPKIPNKKFEALNWMDDKAIMKKQFQSANLPVAKGRSVTNFKQALKIFEQLKKPVIAKPRSGSRSRHTTIHIDTPAELKIALEKAQQLSRWVIIEEELIGSVFRGTVIDGRLVGVLRRDPAAVIGDGKKTVAELIIEENKKSIRQGPLFHHVPETNDPVAEKELKRQNLTWESIPKPEQIVALGTKTSRGVGGGLADVTNQIHLENKKLLERVAEFLNYPYVGIDFIIKNIAEPWQEQSQSGIIECNSLPFIDLHHYPSAGQPRNVAGALWELIFPPTNHLIIP